jgi:hypothetical protein
MDLLAIADRLDRRHADQSLAGARLYGVDGSTDPPTLTHLGDGVVHELLDGPLAELARAFDAVALVSGAWAAPLDELAHYDGCASRHPDRQRVHVTVVSAPSTPVASLLRTFAEGGAGGDVVVGPAAPVGRVPDALAALWLVKR